MNIYKLSFKINISLILSDLTEDKDYELDKKNESISLSK